MLGSVFTKDIHPNIWTTTANNSPCQQFYYQLYILLSSKVGSEFSIVSTFLSETVDILTSEIETYPPCPHHRC